jgi:acetylornithine deacetylase
MKPGAAAALFAVKVLKESGIKLNGDILLTQCADELQGGRKGIVFLIADSLIQDADYCVYTECHPKQHKGKDVIEIGCRGTVNVDITTFGFTQLYFYRKEGKAIDAAVKMANIIQSLDKMEFKNFPEHPCWPHHNEYALATISPPVVPQPWHQIPDICTVTVSTGVVPGQTKEMVAEEVEAVLKKLKAEDPELEYEISNVREVQPAYCLKLREEDPIVKAVQAAIKEVTGRILPTEGTQTQGDASHIYLKAKIPVCKFIFNDVAGDVYSKRAEADERQDINRYIDTIKVYTTLMLNLLK